MQWSKLKKLVEERFASSLGGQVAIFSTRYGNCTCGRAWLTVGGEEVANFCTLAKYNAEAGATRSKIPAGYGELSRQDAYAACWSFVHELSVKEALGDSDPLVQSLSVLDARLGKRRLVAVDWQALHPLAQSLYAFRLQSEALAIPEGLSPPTHAA